ILTVPRLARFPGYRGSFIYNRLLCMSVTTPSNTVDTVAGFLLGGIGELDKHCKPNFLVAFRSFLSPGDIGFILINQCLADLIWHAVKAHHWPLPVVVEIPCKEHPYVLSKDSVLQHARSLFTPEDLH
uniref:V-ATPase 14 kDa subunit n=1 Tax=Melopsittacus undulatus TaxID=13146 RepID=A0A8C6ITQ8_MELUD